MQDVSNLPLKTHVLLRIQAILLGKSWTQRLKSWDYLQSHCFDRSRELGNINRACSVIAAALGCVLMPPWRPCFDGLQYLLREVSILILRLRHIWCCMRDIKKDTEFKIVFEFYFRIVVLCTLIFFHNIIKQHPPTVMRRCGDPFSWCWSVVWVRAWNVALLVSVSPRLQDRVIGLCLITQVSVNITLESSPVQSVYLWCVDLKKHHARNSGTKNIDLYPLVCECVHVGSVRKPAKFSLYHVGASQISVAQVICRGTQRK